MIEKKSKQWVFLNWQELEEEGVQELWDGWLNGSHHPIEKLLHEKIERLQQNWTGGYLLDSKRVDIEEIKKLSHEYFEIMKTLAKKWIGMDHEKIEQAEKKWLLGGAWWRWSDGMAMMHALTEIKMLEIMRLNKPSPELKKASLRSWIEKLQEYEEDVKEEGSQEYWDRVKKLNRGLILRLITEEVNRIMLIEMDEIWSTLRQKEREVQEEALMIFNAIKGSHEIEMEDWIEEKLKRNELLTIRVRGVTIAQNAIEYGKISIAEQYIKAWEKSGNDTEELLNELLVWAQFRGTERGVAMIERKILEGSTNKSEAEEKKIKKRL